MEDRLIREKINSLDTLPEGYAPSLDSKWELLRAGKPEKKKRLPFLYYAAAASIVLLLGFGFLLNRKFVSEPGKPVANAIKITPETKPALPESYKNEPARKPVFAASAATDEQPENAIKNPVKTRIVASVKSRPAKVNIKPEIHTELKPAPEETIIIEPEPAAMAASHPESPAKKRHRYVEVDFDAPATPQRLPQPVQTAQLQFKIKILPQNMDPEPASVQQGKAFRLQHTF